MRYLILLVCVSCFGCAVNVQAVHRGQYADTRVFLNDGEIGVAIRPRLDKIHYQKPLKERD